MSPTDNDIVIVEYSSDYSDGVAALLDELQNHIVSLDPYHIQSLGEGYHAQYLAHVEQTVSQSEGRMFVAMRSQRIVGFVAGIVEAHDKTDELTTNCPTKGRILELIVAKKFRKRGIGRLLMETIEGYLKSAGCEFLYVDVFAPNKTATEFYHVMGYEPRNIELIKKGV